MFAFFQLYLAASVPHALPQEVLVPHRQSDVLQQLYGGVDGQGGGLVVQGPVGGSGVILADPAHRVPQAGLVERPTMAALTWWGNVGLIRRDLLGSV